MLFLNRLGKKLGKMGLKNVFFNTSNRTFLRLRSRNQQENT